MAKGQLDAVFQHLCRSAETRALEALTDQQLLESFLNRRDERAFALVVQRHAALVMSVAQGVLHEVHDAEDVFQATFLVLAKKVGSIRHQPALAGWLYQVAYRLALKARADNIRRRIHERRVATMPLAAPGSTLGQDELRAVLNQELSRLPEKYRTPLVLHYLEGKSKHETAGQLGCTEGTVSGRLARARALLRNRLVRRSLMVSSSGLTAVLTEKTASAVVAPLLVSATVEAALTIARGGTTSIAVSASAASLADGMLKRMLVARIRMVTVALTVGLVVLASGAVTYRAVANNREDSPSAPEANTEAENRPNAPSNEAKLAPAHLSASGKVIDEKGKPIGGATVYLREFAILRHTAELQRKDYTDILAKTTTDAAGRFLFNDVLAEPMKISPSNIYQNPWNLVVMARGYGVSWHSFQSRSEQDVTIRLQPEAYVHGQLLDDKGKPAVGVRVQVSQIDSQIDPERRSRVASRERLMLYWSRVPLVASTDERGQFAMGGLPRQYHIGLSTGDPRFLSKWLNCATIDNAEIERLNRSESVGPEDKLRPDSFTARLHQSATINGEVLCADTGKPAVGAHIRQGIYGTFADQQGRYSLKRNDTEKHYMYVTPPEGSDYLSATCELTIAPSAPNRQKNYTLERGSVITGQLRENETGEPLRVPFVNIHYYCEGVKQYYGDCMTEADGSYRMVVGAGKGKLSTIDTIPGFVPCELFDDSVGEGVVLPFEIKAGETLTGRDLCFSRGMSVQGRVLDTKGQPVPGAVFKGITKQLSSKADGSFTLTGLLPDQKSHFLVIHAQRGLGAKITIEPAKVAKPMTLDVKLQPTQTALVRVLDEQKRPVANAEVWLDAQIKMRETQNGFSYRSLPVWSPLHSDADGRIVLPPLVVDGSYSLYVSAHGFAEQNVPVRPTAGNPLEVPDVVLMTNKFSLSGVVVDAAGKPVQGTQVTIIPRDSAHTQTMLRFVDTKEDGRYYFSGLPKGSYRLSAILWKPTGETDKSGQPVNKMEARTEQRIALGPGNQTIRLTLVKKGQ
ncbi:MAG TPA: sigma-70 family RNA polymerase sigma factor [Gemmataceae bacterium]|nr:sigma-70 family RNA polymerase sigma factor [Gemmataceae bacterium]